MKPLLEKYILSQNCKKFEVPKMNEEILNLLNSFQKKNDLKYIGIQKSLRAGASAVIQAAEKMTAHVNEGSKPKIEEILQITLDTVALIARASPDL